MNRRGFLAALIGAIAAPGVARAQILLPAEIEDAGIAMSEGLRAAVREDLANIIWHISPMDICSFSAVGHASIHEWTVDTLQ